MDAAPKGDAEPPVAVVERAVKLNNTWSIWVRCPFCQDVHGHAAGAGAQPELDRQLSSCSSHAKRGPYRVVMTAPPSH